jgi:hypothetical protein
VARTCRCGCGEPVKGLRRSKQFVDDSHRQRFRRARAAEEQKERANVEVVKPKREEPAWYDEDAPGWKPYPPEHPW